MRSSVGSGAGVFPAHLYVDRDRLFSTGTRINLGREEPQVTTAPRRRLTGRPLLLALVVVSGCGVTPMTDPAVSSAPATTSSLAATTPVMPSSRLSPSPTPSPGPTPSSSASPSPTSTTVPEGLSLVGDRRNAFAFAPLDDPSNVTVEGKVPSTQAWSTSKVLIVAAYLDTGLGGDPDRMSARNRGLVKAALTESDAGAVNAIRDQIPGRPGRAMTAVLRSIGDATTVAPDSYQGLMPWSIREQVRFMAAMANGTLVSQEASAYLMASMRPIRAHRWGLGSVGATAYKGGWLRSNTVTRQMGVLDGYAVAVITAGVGPAVRQTDGDSAHVRQLNRLAARLDERLAYEEARR